MNETSHDAIAVPLRPDGAELQTLSTDVVVEQAKGAICARLSITPDVAFEMLRGLARSQGRNIDEFAAAVVANGGHLDA